MDFAILVAHRVKIKENEKTNTWTKPEGKNCRTWR